MEELKKIQQELKAPKNLTNKFGGYRYRSAEGILESVKPLLGKNNCTLTISDDVVAVGTRVYIKAVATLTNKSGENVTTTAFAREEETKKGMDASQITGTASSYARKYALNGLFAIDDTKDADALNTSPEYTQTGATDVLAEVAKCKTRAELTAVWKGHADLQKDPQFVAAVTAKGKEVAA